MGGADPIPARIRGGGGPESDLVRAPEPVAPLWKSGEWRPVPPGNRPHWERRVPGVLRGLPARFAASVSELSTWGIPGLGALAPGLCA